MNERDELMMLRRLAELEAKAGRVAPSAPAAIDPTEGMSRFDKTAAGVGKAIYDTGRGLGQMVGLVSREDVEESRKRDAALMKDNWGFGGNLVGNIGMLFAPGGLVAGAGAAAKLPQLANAGKALLAPTSIKSALGVGAVTGLAQPSTSTGETALNVGLSALGTAAVPAGVRAYQVAKSAAEPFTAEGKKKIVGRAMQEAAGNDGPALLSVLRDASAPFTGPMPSGVPVPQMMGEIVPGSRQTVGQLARLSNTPSIAALERAATQTDPVVMNEYGKLMSRQNEARRNVLSSMAGDHGRKGAAEASRELVAEKLYSDAFLKGFDPAALNPQMQKRFGDLLSRPSMQKAVNDAKMLAAEEGVELTEAGSVQGLHYAKQSLDAQIADASRKENANLVRLLTKTKNELTSVLEQVSPDYLKANKVFAEMSKPVNQMDVASELLKKSSNPLNGKFYPQKFANNLSDDTAQRVTGFPGATLDNTMTNFQRNSLGALKDDVAGVEFAANAGKAGSDTVQKLAYSNMLSQAGVPNWLRNFGPLQFVGNVAARGADAAYGRANKEIGGLLAEALMNPQTAEEMIRLGIVDSNRLNAISRGGAGLGLLGFNSANIGQ